MNSVNNSPNNSQAAETTQRKRGKSAGMARSFSPIIRQVIVDRFCATRSTEDVAEELRLPVRAVTDVVLAAILRRVPEPQGDTRAPLVMRRTA